MELANAQDVATREDEGQTIQVRDVTGEQAFYGEGEDRKPVTITVVGTYSSAYRRAVDSQRNKMVKRRVTELTGDQLLANQLELTASCVKAWDGFTIKGKIAECTRENVILFLTQAPWIRQQVEEASNDHESFFRTPSGN